MNYSITSSHFEKAINHFATSVFRQNTDEDIAWDMVKNCISILGLEDCVVYLYNDKSKTLTQRAALGPKSKGGYSVQNPLTIPIGKGIVGSIAQKRRSEIVPDTTFDRRYIPDDTVRRSEMAVPINYNDTLIGVIDSEHSEKGFFTLAHLEILITLSSLCANKIARMRAENAMKQQTGYVEMFFRKLFTGTPEIDLVPPRIAESLSLFLEKMLKGKTEEAMELLNHITLLPKDRFDRIVLPTFEGYYFVPVESIVYCEAEGSYTRFITSGGKQLVISRQLSEYERLLSRYHFYRIHNSHLVNLRQVEFVNKSDGGTVIMSNEKELGISQRKRAGFLKELKRYT